MIAIALACAAVVLVFAQKRAVQSDLPAYEIRSVLLREVSPGHYEQVQPRELDALADQGWELVSVMPYIYRNEEHGNQTTNPKPVVTQTYPAYFFKREKQNRGR